MCGSDDVVHCCRRVSLVTSGGKGRKKQSENLAGLSRIPLLSLTQSSAEHTSI